MLEIPTAEGPPRPYLPQSSSIALITPIGSDIALRVELAEPVRVCPSDVMCLLGGRHYGVSALRPCRALVISVPESVVRRHVEVAAVAHDVRESAILKPVQGFVLQLLTSPDALGSLPEYLIETLLWEMVVSILLEGRDGAGLARPRGTHLDRAVVYIAGHRSDQSLTSVSLARALHVSARQLQRVFMTAGTTPSQEIRRQRIDLATSLLRNAAFRSLTIDQIAHQSGFRSGAELRRVLRGAGRESPRALRA